MSEKFVIFFMKYWNAKKKGIIPVPVKYRYDTSNGIYNDTGPNINIQFDLEVWKQITKHLCQRKRAREIFNHVLFIYLTLSTRR